MNQKETDHIQRIIKWGAPHIGALTNAAEQERLPPLNYYILLQYFAELSKQGLFKMNMSDEDQIKSIDLKIKNMVQIFIQTNETQGGPQ